MSNNEWTLLAITPKVGYFVQDGVAIGALINFQSDNQDRNSYELNNNIAEIGVFGRYYVSNNLFSEISLSSKNMSSEDYLGINDLVQMHILNGELVAPGTEGGLPAFDANGAPIYGTVETMQVVVYKIYIGLSSHNQWMVCQVEKFGSVRNREF